MTTQITLLRGGNPPRHRWEKLDPRTTIFSCTSYIYSFNSGSKQPFNFLVGINIPGKTFVYVCWLKWVFYFPNVWIFLTLGGRCRQDIYLHICPCKKACYIRFSCKIISKCYLNLSNFVMNDTHDIFVGIWLDKNHSKSAICLPYNTIFNISSMNTQLL